MQITVISGTNRDGNLSLKVADICRELVHSQGLRADMMDLMALPSDLASTYLGEKVPGFAPFQDQVNRSSHFVFVVPEYNGSIPGILKLFIDACEYPGSFRGKSAVLIGLGAGLGGNQKGLQHLSDILEYCGVQVHAERLTLAKIREKMHPDGHFGDESAALALSELIKGYLSAHKIKE